MYLENLPNGANDLVNKKVKLKSWMCGDGFLYGYVKVIGVNPETERVVVTGVNSEVTLFDLLVNPNLATSISLRLIEEICE